MDSSRGGQAYTREEDATLMRLREAGMPPKQIAQELSRSIDSVYVRVHKLLKQPPQRYLPETQEARRERCVQLFGLGVTLVELAKIYDTSSQVIAYWLNTAGLDAEERQRLRQEMANALPNSRSRPGKRGTSRAGAGG